VSVTFPERRYPAEAETWDLLDAGIRFQADMITFTTLLE
jgi:hypothetical protein